MKCSAWARRYFHLIARSYQYIVIPKLWETYSAREGEIKHALSDYDMGVCDALRPVFREPTNTNCFTWPATRKLFDDVRKEWWHSRCRQRATRCSHTRDRSTSCWNDAIHLRHMAAAIGISHRPYTGPEWYDDGLIGRAMIRNLISILQYLKNEKWEVRVRSEKWEISMAEFRILWFWLQTSDFSLCF